MLVVLDFCLLSNYLYLLLILTEEGIHQPLFKKRTTRKTDITRIFILVMSVFCGKPYQTDAIYQ